VKSAKKVLKKMAFEEPVDKYFRGLDLTSLVKKILDYKFDFCEKADTFFAVILMRKTLQLLSTN
jgi:hypothetical protein